MATLVSVNTPTLQPIGLDEYWSPYVTGCIYGGPGVGKTVVACGSQYMRTFLFDVDKGAMSAASLATSQRLVQGGFPPIQRQLIKAWPVYTYADFEAGINYFWNYRQHFDLAVIDTATELQKIVMKETKGRNKHVFADQRDWGITLEVLENATSLFRDMGKHSLFLAHEVEVFDPNSGTNVFRASFQGQFGQGYRRHFSLIMRYMMINQQVLGPNQQLVNQTVRCLDCHKDVYNDCKDRSSALEKYEVPILDNIFYKVLTAINPQSASTG